MKNYFHVHTIDAPYCTSYPSTGPEPITEAWQTKGVILRNIPFSARECPYRQELDRNFAPVPVRQPPTLTPGILYGMSPDLHNREMLADEQRAKNTVDSALATPCPECGEMLGDHEHPTKGGGERVVTVTTRSTGPRKKQEERAPCPHCGGPMHFNDAGGKTNWECLHRQYEVAAGRMTDPLREKLPVATHTTIAAVGSWIDKQDQSKLHYGKMESGGGAATFSQLRGMKGAGAGPVTPTPVLAPKPTVQWTTIDPAADPATAPAPEPEPEPEPETEEQAAERKLEETRKKDRERKAARRALLKDASK